MRAARGGERVGKARRLDRAARVRERKRAETDAARDGINANNRHSGISSGSRAGDAESGVGKRLFGEIAEAQKIVADSRFVDDVSAETVHVLNRNEQILRGIFDGKARYVDVAAAPEGFGRGGNENFRAQQIFLIEAVIEINVELFFPKARKRRAEITPGGRLR